MRPSLAGFRSQVTRRSIGIVTVGMFVSGVAVLYGVGWQLSRPIPASVGPAPPELQAESVEFPSESGSLSHGWLSRGATHGGAVLRLPAVRANRRSMVDRAQLLHAAGYSTLLIDFQATGESPGEIITFGDVCSRSSIVLFGLRDRRTSPRSRRVPTSMAHLRRRNLGQNCGPSGRVISRFFKTRILELIACLVRGIGKPIS
jgi:hypothetical protein